jgi:hypothetical protein
MKAEANQRQVYLVKPLAACAEGDGSASEGGFFAPHGTELFAEFRPGFRP